MLNLPAVNGTRHRVVAMEAGRLLHRLIQMR